MTPNKNEIGRKPYLIDRVLFLNGVTRAGKFLLGKLVSGIDTVEHAQNISILEQLPFLTRLGFVQEEAAISLMRINVDEHAYNTIIGRNLNFRVSDASSLFNVPHVHEYLLRSLSGDIPALLDKFRRERHLPSFIIHEALPDIELVFKAFPDVSIIDLQRHPVDVVSSWFARGWGNRQGDDPLSFAPVLKGVGGGPLPWHAESWREEYDSSSPIDRVIRSVAFLVEEGEKTYARLAPLQQQRILRITYEALVEETRSTVHAIAAFLDLPVRETLPVIMAREKVPRSLPREARVNKIGAIEKVASPGKLDMLHALSDRYEATLSRSAPLHHSPR